MFPQTRGDISQQFTEWKTMFTSLAGHVMTMARDKWGSLVLAGALSHVDDTVLLRKCILSALQVSVRTSSSDCCFL